MSIFDRDDRVQYPRYITTIRTRDRGVLVSRPDQHPAALVIERYGDRAGLYPWNRDGIAYLVVAGGNGPEEYQPVYEGDEVTELVANKVVIDYVYELSQEPVRRR